jgi:tRNA G37 N-methylase TrmD
MSESIPAATIRGTFTTYENMKQQNLNNKLGNVVDLTLEDLVKIELGGWGTMLNIRCLNGAVPSIKTNSDGSFSVLIQPTGKKASQSINNLAGEIVKILTQPGR